MAQSDPGTPQCQGWTRSGVRLGHRCERPAKDGYNYCGPHLAGKRRREATTRRFDAETRERDALVEHRRLQRVRDANIVVTKDRIVDLVRDIRDRGVLSVADLIKYKEMLVDELGRLETLEASRP